LAYNWDATSRLANDLAENNAIPFPRPFTRGEEDYFVADFTGNSFVLNWTDDGSQTGGLPAASRFYRIVVP
jgi:hypothetical protein